MAAHLIQLGQVWRSDANGQDYLVTKVYHEVFSQFAMLRPAGIAALGIARVYLYPGQFVLGQRKAAALLPHISDTLNRFSLLA